MCGEKNFTLVEYQQAGFEAGSTYDSQMPTAEEIAAMGAKLLSIDV